MLTVDDYRAMKNPDQLEWDHLIDAILKDKQYNEAVGGLRPAS